MVNVRQTGGSPNLDDWDLVKSIKLGYLPENLGQEAVRE